MLHPPGTRVGKYVVQSELGKGAMGVVYVARDPILDRDVALKVMAATILEDGDLKERFRREAQAVARLQSPNIVTVYDFGYDEQNAPYIAMELLSGTDLEAKMRTDPPSLTVKLNIVIQICKGLGHAHQHGIIHRDVKPANVFLTRSGLVKIMDFGTARLVQSTHTQTGTVMGTVAYMSPEQIQGQRVDGRSDIFSLGVLLYRLLCHQQPFGGENVHHIIYKILNVQPANLVLSEGQTVPPLQHIVDRALSKDLEQRYETAEKMAADLEAFLRDYTGSLTEDTVFRTLPAGSAAPAMPPPVPATRVMAVEPTALMTSLGAGTVAVGDDAPTTFLDASDETLTIQGRSAARRGTAPIHAQAKPTRRTLPWIAAAVLLVAAGVAGGVYFSRSGQAGDAATLDVPLASTALPGASPPGADVTEDDVTEDADGTASSEPVMNGPGSAAPPPAAAAELASAPPSQTAPATQAPPPPPRSAPPPVVAAPPPQTAPPPAAATQQAAAVRAALGANDLERARTLIEQGRTAEPGNPVWQQLAQEALAQESAGQGNRFLRAGLDHFAAGRFPDAVAAYDQAIAAFRQAEQAQPGSAGALDGQFNAARYKREAEEAMKSATAGRKLSESKTEFVAAESSGPEGFVLDENVKVERGTTNASAPGELAIELNPTNAQPGAPYALTVRLRNKSNSTLFAKSLELVSVYRGGQRIGAGTPIDLGLRRIDSQDSAILKEVRDVWSEDQDQGGKITATVTLSDDSRLKKTLEWSGR